VRVERSGNDVVKKAHELDIEKPGDKHKEARGEEKTVGEETNGEAQAGDKRKADEPAEKKDEETNGDAKKQKTDEANGEKPASKKKGRPAKKDANGETKPKKEVKKVSSTGSNPSHIVSLSGLPLQREPKKPATESGEPRRSGRVAANKS
jgi:hypothetical protein